MTNLDLLDVCMLFQGEEPHPAHETFGNSLDAEYRHFETSNEPNGQNQNVNSELARVRTGLVLLDKYDIVLAEGSAPLQTLLAYKISNPSVTALYLAADETFLTLSNRKSDYLWRLLGPIAQKELSGIIAVSRDAYKWSHSYLGDLPYTIVHPPIQDEKYRALVDLPVISPQDEFIIVSTGEARPSNNYETLVAATDRLRENHDISVTVVFLGNGHPEEEYASSERVVTPGFVSISKFSSWLKAASIYVQPSIGDAFPVATLEGMLSGTPALVTNRVGVRELLPDDQCVEPSAKGLELGIKYIYEIGRDERERRGNEQRELVKPLDEQTQQNKFRERLSMII